MGLRVLRLGRNRVSDLSPLRGLTRLEGLIVDFNRIEDISPVFRYFGAGSITTGMQSRYMILVMSRFFWDKPLVRPLQK